MNLDDLAAFRGLDSRGLLTQINDLPNQMEQVYARGARLSMPVAFPVERILLAAGDPGSHSCGFDMFSAWSAGHLKIPLILQTGASLPVWAQGKTTLVVVHSMSEQDTLAWACCDKALASGCSLLMLTPEGMALDRAQSLGLPFWVYPAGLSTSSTAAWVFGLLHGLFYRLGILPAYHEILSEGLHALRNAQMTLLAEVPVVKNPAKRLAGQMLGRWTVLFAPAALAPVARYWKTQLNARARIWSQVELVPLAVYETLDTFARAAHPLDSMFALFLSASSLSPADIRGLEFSRDFILQQGFVTDLLDARGATPYSHLWTSLLFADYTVYYLAMASGVDPGVSPVLEYYQSSMSWQKG